MKTTYEWLESLVPTGKSPEEVADLLTYSGTEVEHISESDDGQTVYQLEVTSNRVDCLGNLGLAREISALTGISIQEPKREISAAGSSSEAKVSIDDDALSLCPHYTAHLIKGVKVGPSPAWLQKRLEAIGCATVNNIVDITNYVLFEYSQPLHAFDYDLLKGGEIRVRRANAGEKFEAINHRTYELSTDDLVIADAERAVALAGVMGGVNSEIHDGSVNVLLESAYFDPQGVKATGRRMDRQHSENLESDSRYRFERGVDPAGIMSAAERAVHLILEVAGGEMVAPSIEAGKRAEDWIGQITIRASAIERTLGDAVPMDKVKSMFQALGLGIESASDSELTCRIPSFRRDLKVEIDLIEEVARLWGLDKFESRLTLPISPSRADSFREDADQIRRYMLGMGFDECLTDTFVPGEGAFAITSWSASKPMEARAPVNVNRPSIRQSALPSLIEALGHNVRQGNKDVRLFEISALSLNNDVNGSRSEMNCLVLVAPDLESIKGAAATILNRMHVDGVNESEYAGGLFAEGEALQLSMNGELAGVIGMASEALQSSFSLPYRPAMAELHLDLLLKDRDRTPPMKSLPRYPEVHRDLAAVVDEKIRWADIESLSKSKGGESLREVKFFDEFRGKQIPKGKKSVAWSLVFRDDERTLVHQEVDASVDAIVSALEEKMNAELRK